MRNVLNWLCVFSSVLLAASLTQGQARAQDGPPKTRLNPVSSGRAAGLAPITRGRAARLLPVNRTRPAALPRVSAGRRARLPGVSSGRAARLLPVSRGRAAKSAPVTRDRAAALRPVSTDRAAGLAPLTGERDAALPPVTSGRAAGLSPVSAGRPARLAPVTRDRAAGLSPVTGVADAGAGKGFYSPHSGADADRPAAYSVRSVGRGRDSAPGRLVHVPSGTVEVLGDGYEREVLESRDPAELGRKALAEGRKVYAALCFREALDRDRRDTDAAFGLADALLGLGNLDAAAESLRVGFDGLSNWAEDLDRNRIASRKGELEPRLKLVSGYAKKHPRNEGLTFLLGYLQMSSGVAEEVARAGRTLRTALDLDPDGRHTLRLIKFLQAR